MESHEGLYILFKTVCDVYSLIQEENYTIPPEAERLVAEKKEDDVQEGKAVLKKESHDEDVKGEDADATTTISTGATTRRHKHTPSMGSAVTTIAEGDEEDNVPESPAKEKASGSLDAISSSMTKEALIGESSETAAKKEELTAERKPEAEEIDTQAEAKDAAVKGEDNLAEASMTEENEVKDDEVEG